MERSDGAGRETDQTLHPRAASLLSIAQAAARLGVNRTTVWRWIAAGKLPAYRAGSRTIRLRLDDLETALQPVGGASPTSDGRPAEPEGSEPDEARLRRSEERYRAFVEQSTEGIWRFELEQPIPTNLPLEEQIEQAYQYSYLAECNAAMARMYGYQRAEELIGARLDDLLVRSDPANLAYLTAFIQSGYRLVDAESEELDRDGNRRIFLNNLIGIVEDGCLVRAWGTQRDITERQQADAERELLLAREQQARAAAERAADRTARLQAVSAALSEALTPEQVASSIGEQARVVLGAESAMIARLSENGSMLEVIGATGSISKQLAGWERFPLSTPVPLAEAVRTATPIWPESTAERIARYPHLKEAYTANPPGAWLSIPLVAQGRAIGGLSLSFRESPALEVAEREFVLALARQCAQALDRARLYDAERRARAEVETARQRLAFLAEASELLSSSLEYEPTLASLARLVVPALADWCGIEMLRADGTTEQLAVAHIDPAKVELARELRRQYPPDFEAPRGLPQVLRTGQPELVEEVSDALLAALARDEKHLRIVRDLGLTSAMIVPLVARERILGAITLVAAESGRRYGAQDLAFAEELARRAALAIDNARLYREAREAIGTRDEFLSIASHELRTPLTVLSTHAQMLQRQTERGQLDPALVGRSARAITDQSNKLVGLILQLLDVSRMEAGKLQLEPECVDLVEFVKRYVSTIRAESPSHPIRLEAPERLEASLDPLRFEQVLTNLVDNAIKYSPEGGPIEVGLRCPSPELIELAVQDRGLGIPPEQRGQIFERFFQAHGAGRRSGLGLGLYISRQIVELHGGQIWAEFPESGGSRFVVRLPSIDGEPRSRSQALSGR